MDTSLARFCQGLHADSSPPHQERNQIWEPRRNNAAALSASAPESLNHFKLQLLGEWRNIPACSNWAHSN
jgi:hypothetical protein